MYVCTICCTVRMLGNNAAPPLFFRAGGESEMASEVYQAWKPSYRDPKGASAAAPVPADSGIRFQSGLKQQVSVREDQKRDTLSKVRL